MSEIQFSGDVFLIKFDVTEQQENFWGDCDEADPDYEYPDGDWADLCIEIEPDYVFYGGSKGTPATWHDPGDPGEDPSVQVSDWTLTHGNLVVSLDDEGLKLMGIDPEELEAELVQHECQAGLDDMAEDAWLARQEAKEYRD